MLHILHILHIQHNPLVHILHIPHIPRVRHMPHIPHTLHISDIPHIAYIRNPSEARVTPRSIPRGSPGFVGAPLDCIWIPLGALCEFEGPLEASLEPLRASFERPWAPCGALWRPLDVPKASLKGPKRYRRDLESSQRVTCEAPGLPKESVSRSLKRQNLQKACK